MRSSAAHEPQAEQHQRDRRHPLQPPVRDAVFRGAKSEHATDRTAQAHARTSARAAQYKQPEQRGRDERAEEHDPAAQTRGLALQAMAGVPGQVPHAVQQVIEECERETDQQDARPADDRRTRAQFRTPPRRSPAADQPVDEQQQADRQRTARHAMQDRQGHRVLPAVHGQKRRQRPSDECSCYPSSTPERNRDSEINAAPVLFPIAVARGIGAAATADLARSFSCAAAPAARRTQARHRPANSFVFVVGSDPDDDCVPCDIRAGKCARSTFEAEPRTRISLSRALTSDFANG